MFTAELISFDSIAGLELSISEYSTESFKIVFNSNYMNQGYAVFGDMFFLKRTLDKEVLLSFQ